MDCTVVAGPRNGDDSVNSGSSFQWVLANTGALAWPEMTTLRLIGGPALMTPMVEVPPAAPGQTVVIDMEVAKAEESANVSYVLVTPDGCPFGEIFNVTVLEVAKPEGLADAHKNPVCIIVASPADDEEGLQGELKTVEWTLANVGDMPWPEDVCATLFYNSPDIQLLPLSIQIPSIQSGMTAIVSASILMPEAAGQFKAMWAVTSPTHPEFGEVLHVAFNVDEFPFMEWMLVNTTSTEEEDVQKKKELGQPSMSLVMHNHLIPNHGEVSYVEAPDGENIVSLGRVTGLACGEHWILEMLFTNDGKEQWPDNAQLRHCFGDDLGCQTVTLGGVSVQPGETIAVQMELCVPVTQCQSAWVMIVDEMCIGPSLMLEIQ